MTTDRLTISEAAKRYHITIASILRMDSEGWVIMNRIGNEFYVLVRDLERVAAMAKDEPRLSKCECIGGPCECPTSPVAP